MVSDFLDQGKRDLHYLTVSTFNFDAGGGKSLRRFKTSNGAPESVSILGNDFNIVLAIERLKCRQSLADFHPHPPVTSVPGYLNIRYCTLAASMSIPICNQLGIEFEAPRKLSVLSVPLWCPFLRAKNTTETRRHGEISLRFASRRLLSHASVDEAIEFPFCIG